MNIINSYKKALNVIIHPSKAQKMKDVGDALVFYYSIIILPFILSLIVSTIFSPSILSFAISVATFLVFFLVYPLSIFIGSVLFYILIRKAFNLYKNNYTDTFTAFVYSGLPYVLFYWLAIIPTVGYIVYILLSVWSLLLAIWVFSKMFNISKLKAFGIILLNDVVWAVIALIIVLLLVLPFATV